MALKLICIDGTVYFGQYDYRPTPPTKLPTAIGFVDSSNPGTLVLSGFENRQPEEIIIPYGSKIDIEDICLYVVETITQTKNEIVLTVTDWASMQ